MRLPVISSYETEIGRILYRKYLKMLRNRIINPRLEKVTDEIVIDKAIDSRKVSTAGARDGNPG